MLVFFTIFLCSIKSVESKIFSLVCHLFGGQNFEKKSLRQELGNEVFSDIFVLYWKFYVLKFLNKSEIINQLSNEH